MKKNVSNNSVLAYSYIRMSTAVQMKGDSLRRQTEASRNYAREHGLTLAEDSDLRDIGISAYSGRNADKGALGKFIKAAEDGIVPKGSYLIVESFDRLTRQKIEPSLQLFLRILQAGINLVTLMDGQVYRAGDDNAMKLMQSISYMARAHDESAHKSRRLSATWTNKRNNIETRKLTAKAPAWLKLNKSRTTFEVDESKAEIVRGIFESAASGIGSYTITRDLNQEAVTPFGRSKHWIKSYVTKILTERAVLGEFQPHEMIEGKRTPVGELIRDYYPRVISDELYQRVQLGRSTRKIAGKGRKGTNISNLFTNIALCDYCQSPMNLIDKGVGPKGGKYLKCSNAIHGAGCSSKAWKYNDFERSFLFFCRELDLPDLLREGAKKSERAQLSENIRLAKLRIAELSDMRDRTFSLLNDAKTSSDYIVGKLEEIQRKMIDLTSEIASMENLLKTADENVSINDKEIVKSIGYFANHDSNDRKHRYQLRTRILDIVETITLAPAGDKLVSDLQYNAELAAISEKMDKDFLFSGRLQKELERIHPKNRSQYPVFKVSFVGNLARVVVVDSSDPLKFIAIFNRENGKLSSAQNWHAVNSLPNTGAFVLEAERSPRGSFRKDK
jgi:DNA invertase Pin-like site-specific DNA recombinase